MREAKTLPMQGIYGMPTTFADSNASFTAPFCVLKLMEKGGGHSAYLRGDGSTTVAFYNPLAGIMNRLLNINFKALCIAALCVCGLVQPSLAALYVGEFELRVTSVYVGITNDGSYGYESGKIIDGVPYVFGLAVGDTWIGHYSYESPVPDGFFSYDARDLNIVLGYPEYLTGVSHDEGPSPYLSVADGHVTDASYRYGWSGYYSYWGTVRATTFDGCIYSSPSWPEEMNSLSGTVRWKDPALIPEPSALTLLAAFGVGLLGRATLLGSKLLRA